LSCKKRKLQASESQSRGSAIETTTTISQITGADVFRSLQEVLTASFGIVGSSTTELSIRLYDAKLRIAIIKTSREKYPLVRSSLSFLTQIKQVRVVATTIGVSGSARTARNAAWKEVQRRFFGRELKEMMGVVDKDGSGHENGREPWSKKSRGVEKELLELEERLDKIDSGC
jgi:RNase P/RNase MRP subunit POP5